MPLSAELFEGISASSQPEITDIPFSNSTLHIVKLSNPRCYCICIDRDNRGVQIATWTNSAFSGWKPFATATKPQEFDLPLVEGITGYAKYSKDQFGHVLIMLQDIQRSDGFALGIGQITTIATLPAGFRSSRDIYTNAVATGSAGTPILGIYQLWLYADGRVCCLAESGISPVKLRGALWYAAAD